MKNMKIWWTAIGWPWLKDNWWMMIIFPVVLIVWVLVRMKPQTILIDPTEKADERAQLEADTRSTMLEAENERLAIKLDEVEKEHASLREHFEKRLSEEVESLRSDPEKLRQRMLDVGPGKRP